MPRKKKVAPMSRSKVKQALAELEGDFTCLQKRFSELKIKAEKEGITVSAALDTAVAAFNNELTALNTAVANAASGASEQPAIDALNKGTADIKAAIVALGGTPAA